MSAAFAFVIIFALENIPCSFNGEFFIGISSREYGTTTLSWKVERQLPSHEAKYPGRMNNLTAPLRKPENSIQC